MRKRIGALLRVASMAANALASQAARVPEMVRQQLEVGTPTVVRSVSANGRYAVVFEDDGDTGYFHALDHRRVDQPIVDALHIYDASTVVKGDRQHTLRIAWSDDAEKAALFLNDYPHAVFDFAARRGYCRTNFPPPNTTWTEHDHAWDGRVLQWFK
jgi:hypothetical protein